MGSDWEGDCCLGSNSGPTALPLPEGMGASILSGSWCGLAKEGVPPVREAHPLPSQQLMSQTPQSSWGPKCRVTLTPAAIETDRGGALPHNARPSSSSSSHFLKSFCLLVPWAWRLSHSPQMLPIKFKMRPLGKGSGTLPPSSYLPGAIPTLICLVSREQAQL